MTATFSPRPDMIQVTYRVLSDKLIDPEKRALAIAASQTAETKRLKQRSVVIGIDERTHVAGKPYEYYLTIGVPPSVTEGDIPTLLNVIFGKACLEGQIRLDHVQFPEDYLKGKGPKFGVPGIRKLVGEPDKPLIMATIKPGIGHSADELGKAFYDLAAGGIHLVHDEEILSDLTVCPTEKRLSACLEASERAKMETGQTTLYALNLTGPTSKLVTRAKKLVSQGAQCLMVNVLCYGYGSLEELRSVGVPIVASSALAPAVTGIRYPVSVGSLMRLGGADIVLFPSSYGGNVLTSEEARAVKAALTASMGPLLKSFPAPCSGVFPGLVPRILQEFGNDVMIHAGDSVHTHSQGPRAGAKAFKQAIAWTVKRGNLGGISQREFPELFEALRLWGKG